MRFLLSIFFFLTYGILDAKEVIFLFVRHGETDWNVERRVQGCSDIPLNEKGKIQALLVAEMLVKEHGDIKSIYSSDLSRAYSTALLTAEKLQLPIHVRASFREFNTGIAEGMLIEEKEDFYKNQYAELKKKYPDRKERWHYAVIPGEETIAQLIKRVKDELIVISDLTQDKEKVAVFSHGKTMRALIADIENKELEDVMNIPNCSVIPVIYNSDSVKEFFSILKEHD